MADSRLASSAGDAEVVDSSAIVVVETMDAGTRFRSDRRTDGPTGDGRQRTAVLTFVYGTLTNPKRVAAVLEGVEYEFAGRATLEGCHRVDGRYPTLAPGGHVEGRLLAVDRSALEALDAYEGVDAGLYVRIAVPLEEPDESLEVDSAWTYVGRPSRLGVADRVTWPGSGPFADRVRRTVERDGVVVVSHTTPSRE